MQPTIAAQPENIPDELKQRDQFVCWRFARSGEGASHRWCKQPISPIDGQLAKITSPETWSDFGTAVNAFQRNKSRLAGIGYVFTNDDPFVGIDLDHCRDTESRDLTEWASKLVDELDSYTEVSPSGTGVKIILKSAEMVPSRRKSSPGIEIYSSQRYFTLTGNVLNGHEQIHTRTEQLLSVHQQYFLSADFTASASLSTSEEETLAATDQQILQRANRARNRKKFQSLWYGSTNLHASNHSQADLALCRILAFWCGPRPQQIDRLYRQSKLYRPKWDESHFANGSTYGEMTIVKAIAGQDGTFFPWSSSPCHLDSSSSKSQSGAGREPVLA
ncbi:hypothetical protein [Rubinisphaera sp. JC750]|uniref:phage NrS-1 polymerase family protein n=1 Tax=Rubinisphaera sp. JC750 TaxID=2898658 RepID=UPI001F4112E4|nr:hypothetical protein [Rubinisphaera sp. JC750]